MTLPGLNKPQPHPSWTPQEVWVWSQILSGGLADLGRRPGALVWGESDPFNPDSFPEDRIITGRFLRKVFFEANYRAAINPAGVLIKGARFEEPLDLAGVEVEGQLMIAASRFEGYVNLTGARVGGSLSLAGSFFEDVLSLAGAEIGGNLFLSGGASLEELDLSGASVGGRADLTGIECTGTASMDSLKVEGALLLSGGSELNYVSLQDAFVGGQLVLNGAALDGAFSIEASRFGGDVLMRDLVISPSTTFEIVYSQIGANLEIPEEMVSRLVLTHTRVAGDMMIGLGQTEPYTPGGSKRKSPKKSPKKSKNHKQSIHVVKPEKNGRVHGVLYSGLYPALLANGFHSFGEEMLYEGLIPVASPIKSAISVPSAIAWMLARYGYSWYFVLFWAVLLVAIGSVVAEFGAEGEHSGFLASLDAMIPFLRLGYELPPESMTGFAKAYFVYHGLMGFGLTVAAVFWAASLLRPYVDTPRTRTLFRPVSSAFTAVVLGVLSIISTASRLAWAGIKRTAAVGASIGRKGFLGLGRSLVTGFNNACSFWKASVTVSTPIIIRYSKTAGRAISGGAKSAFSKAADILEQLKTAKRTDGRRVKVIVRQGEAVQKNNNRHDKRHKRNKTITLARPARSRSQ